jgi:hypothetical protein
MAYFPNTYPKARGEKQMTRSRWIVAATVTLLGVCAGARGVMDRRALAAQPKKGVDPEADRLLRQMTDYLADLQSFTVQGATTDEVAFKSGEKIQTMADSEIAVARPNRLRSTQVGAEGLGFFYDGKTMTVACKANGSYETVPAPPTLDATIDKMRKQFQVEAPGADLLASRPYDVLMEQVVSGRVIGRETVDGVATNHLAFQGEEVDWQVWIQDGAEPLPLRFVITTKTVKGHPEFALRLSNWNTKPRLPATAFEFQAPPGAKSAQSVAASCGRTH